MKKAETLKTKKLDKKNKLTLVKKDGSFLVVSYRKNFFGIWRQSEYALDYTTDLIGDKIVMGKYQGFDLYTNALRWFNFLDKKYTTRVHFIGA